MQKIFFLRKNFPYQKFLYQKFLSEKNVLFKEKKIFVSEISLPEKIRSQKFH